MARIAVASLAVFAAGCGGGGDDGGGEASNGAAVTTTTAGTDPTGGDGGSTSPDQPTTTTGDRDLEPPEYLLTGDTEGTGQTIEPACAETEPNQSAQPLFSYLAPEGWTQVGGSATNSGVWNANGERDFDPGTGATADRVSVGVAYDDNRNDEGELEDPDDYSLTGDSPDVGPFESVGTVDVDGTEVDLVGFDTADTSYLRARLVFAEAPSVLLRDNPRVDYWAVVSVEYGTGNASFDQAAAEEMIASMRLAECSQEEITTVLEQLTGADFS